MEKNKKHPGKTIHLLQGLSFGIVFGFLLQKSGVSYNDTIMNQLTLTDFTVVKVMLSAIVTGLICVNYLHFRQKIVIQAKPGGIGMTIPGSLLFGVGFALSGYCPGTVAAAIGQGSLDALFASLPGIILGSWLFVLAYPFLCRTVLPYRHWGNKTLSDMIRVPRGTLTLCLAFSCTLILLIIEILNL